MENNEPWYWKAERFFGKNWMFIVGSVVLSNLYFAYSLNSMNEQIESVSKTTNDVLVKNTKSALIATADGRFVEVLKAPIDAQKYKNHVASKLRALCVDKMSITKNFAVVPQTEKDILANSIQLAEFKKLYINPNNQKANEKFDGVLRLLLSMQKDKLPDSMTVTSSEVKDYSSDKEKFTIIAEYGISSRVLSLADNSYVDKLGKITIKATGSFNLLDTNEDNPIGLSFDSIVPIYLEK